MLELLINNTIQCFGSICLLLSKKNPFLSPFSTIFISFQFYSVWEGYPSHMAACWGCQVCLSSIVTRPGQRLLGDHAGPGSSLLQMRGRVSSEGALGPENKKGASAEMIRLRKVYIRTDRMVRGEGRRHSYRNRKCERRGTTAVAKPVERIPNEKKREKFRQEKSHVLKHYLCASEWLMKGCSATVCWR